MIRSHIAFIGLLLYSFSWLLADHYRPWTSFHSEALALIALGVLSFSQLLSAKEVTLPYPLGWISLIFFLPWVLPILGLDWFGGDSLLLSFYFVGLFLAIWLGFDLASHAHGRLCPRFTVSVLALWIAALISATLGLMQWLHLEDYLGTFAVQTEMGARAAGNLGQPNQLATLLLMGMAALVYVYQSQVIGKTGMIAAVTFLTAVLVLTQSRAGMVSVVVMAAFLLWKQSAGSLRLSKQAVLVWVGGFALATVSLPSVSEWLLMSGSRSLTSTGSISERWLIWKQVTYAITQAPWLGYGWNQTPTANAVGALAFPGSTTYTNAHNIVLDLMVWCGIPLGLLLTGLMAYWFISRMRAVKHPGAILAMAALLPIAVHSLLEFPFAYAYFLISAGFFVGIVEAAHAPTRTMNIRVRWLWLVLAGWTAIGACIAYEYLQIEEDFRIVRFENMRVGATPVGYEPPQIWMLSHMGAMLSAARQVPKPDMPEAELENLRKVSDRFAYGAIRFKYAQALALNGDPEGASKQMQIIHGMYGDLFYKACKDELLRLTAEKYPQLSAVKLSD